MHVYFDEAGDLGFSFKHEFMQGGSSRYLTLGFLLVNSNLRHIVKRLTIDFRKKHGFPRRRELKGKLLNPANLQAFVVAANSLLSSGDDFRFRSITVRKEHVQEHIRGDSNKLYNYMIRLCLLPHIFKEPEVTLVPDPRSVKVASGNSMIDYLQTILWMHMGSKTQLRQFSVDSDKCLQIQFTDVLTHVVWSYYEFGQASPFDSLSSSIVVKELFFKPV